MSRAEGSSTNTLGLATSPYLRQHADNPVHWQQWTPEALGEAAARDVPILLSIGYAACHWCHVMAHESFEDDEVAAAMNAGFVCIKVDREERPDIDAVYMNATVALTGHGGWPMTCFLTPDGRPFFCGTYYPKDAFLQLLSAVRATWRERRGEVEEASDRIAGELREMAQGFGGAPGAGPELVPALCDHAVASVLALSVVAAWYIHDMQERATGPIGTSVASVTDCVSPRATSSVNSRCCTKPCAPPASSR